MLNRFLIMLFAVASLHTGAQPGSRFLWATTPGGLATERTYASTMDKSGDIYLTGTFRGTSYMGPDTLVATTQNVYVAKFDSAGNILWARQSGGSGVQFAYAVSTDRFNNVYITGSFSSTIFFDSDTLTSAGAIDLFIVKYDASGNLQWAKRAGGTLQDVGNTVASDPFGSIYIGGYFSGTAYFDSLAVNSSGSSIDLFLTKLNADGEFTWVKTAGGPGTDQSTALVTDDSCNLYYTGYFLQSIQFNTDSLNYGSRTGYFIAKYDSSGSELWIRGGTGNTGAEAYDVALDSTGAAYLTGTYEGGEAFIGTDTLMTNGGSDLFIAKYDDQGNYNWSKGYGSATSSDLSNTITVNKQGLVYTGGSYQSLCRFGNDSVYGGNLFVAKFDYNGNFIHGASATGRSLTGSVSDTAGGLFVSGDFYQYGYFGKDTINVGSAVQKIYLSKLGECGTVSAFPLCLVSVDSSSTHNILVWEQQPGQAFVDSFIIYRAPIGGSFIKVGAIDRAANSVFTDITSRPDLMSYEYRIAMVDECNVRGPLSFFHTTIYLQYQGNGLFNWTPYTVENSGNTIASYSIYRDNLGNGNFQFVQVVSPSILSWTDPVYLTYPNARYRIVVNSWLIGGNCNPTRNYAASLSNVCTNVLPVGISQLNMEEVKLYPNPAVGYLNIELPTSALRARLDLKVMDVFGAEKLFMSNIMQNISVNTEALSSGIYTLQLVKDGTPVFLRKFVVR